MMLRNKIKQLEELKQKQLQECVENRCDENIGLYNGIEISLAVLQNREPSFLCNPQKQEIEVENLQTEENRRTITSGIVRR